jgi:cell division protein FtsQ
VKVPERSRRPALASEDVPSAEVLDELLQAFSIDVTDRARFDEIDLTSPEVERLLMSADAPGATPEVEAPEPDIETTPEPSVEASPDAEDTPRVEVEGPLDEERDAPEPEVEPPSTGPQPAVEVEQQPATADASPPPAPGPVVITDDEIPDAVYVKGTLATDSSGERSTIFIDDRAAAAGETITMEAATKATRIEPRLRDRRLAVKKAAGRKRLKWALIITAVIAVLVGGLAVLGSSLFSVDDVEVEGAVYTDEEALAAIVEDVRGEPVLRLDTAAIEKRLEAIPWVQDARVSADFPDRVKIELREREPAVAFQADDDRYRVIDDEGRVLDVVDGQPVEYLELTSSERPALAAGQFAPEGFGAAASLVQALTPEMAARARSIAVAPDGSDLRLTLRGGTEVRFGAAEDLVVKLVRLQTVLNDHAGEPLTVIDVATNEVTFR